MADLTKAQEHFIKLLEAQIDRVKRMSESDKVVSFADRDKVVIGIIGGDGIGPGIVKQAKRVLEQLLADELGKGSAELRTIEGLTLEKRMASGESVPRDVLEQIKQCDVLLKGPTTTPNGGTLESANVTLRRELDLFANVRPVCVPEENIDWMFFRENTEGEYVLGSSGIDLDGELCMDFKVTTRPGTERISRAAFDYAKTAGKTRVSVVTKANIMKKTDGMFSQICREIASEYPGIETDEWYIDIMSANLVNKEIRSGFQVFLMPNLYGDILTDEAAQLQGGVGTAGSANIGDRYAMFEAIHGSAPRLIEEGRGDFANPASILKAAEMLLRHIGRVKEADRLDKALRVCTQEEKKVRITEGADSATTEQFTDYLLEVLKSVS